MFFSNNQIDKNYGGVIWSNHSVDRMIERGLKQEKVWHAFKNADSSYYAKTKRAYVYQKVINKKLYEVVVKKTDDGKWLIMTCWAKPAYLYKPKVALWEKIIKLIWKKFKTIWA